MDIRGAMRRSRSVGMRSMANTATPYGNRPVPITANKFHQPLIGEAIINQVDIGTSAAANGRVHE
jgi:hypothetical protein